ncbi:MAG: hypothetical protein ABH808_01060 [Candidatus Kuenenbacteria bacterium]
MKAIIIWYQEGNLMLNLAERWGERVWKLYQKDSEKFIKKGFDSNISSRRIKDDLLEYSSSKHRLGFSAGNYDNYNYTDAKLSVRYDKEDEEEKEEKRKFGLE